MSRRVGFRQNVTFYEHLKRRGGPGRTLVKTTSLISDRDGLTQTYLFLLLALMTSLSVAILVPPSAQNSNKHVMKEKST